MKLRIESDWNKWLRNINYNLNQEVVNHEQYYVNDELAGNQENKFDKYACKLGKKRLIGW